MYTDSSQFHRNNFSKTVLSWDFATLSKPLEIAIRQSPLPKIEYDIEKYYANFLPLILEEARAIITNGLEMVNAKPFKLILKKQPHLPRNEGNPMSMFFHGSIPEKIEHGASMNVLLLKTKGIHSEIKFIAIATENQGSSEIFAKIIIPSKNYDDNEACFAEDQEWQAHYLGSVISEERMYDACLTATDCSCVQQIARARIQTPYTTRIATRTLSINRLNLSQREAIYAFLNAQEGSTVLLQGPPGTGKTTTLVALLSEVANQGKRTMVSAHSNKGVQVLALRALDEMTNIPMILVGAESKLHEKLKPIFLNSWHEVIRSYFFVRHKELEILASGSSERRFSRIELISEINKNVCLAQEALSKFDLLYSPQLSKKEQKTLLTLSRDPILVSDFQVFQSHIDQLKTQPQTKELWGGLLTILNRLMDKWTKIKKEMLENYLLDHAKIIFSTLICAGRKSMLAMAPIDFLLVDEAAQSIEAATLIPMRFKPKKTLLVGDTKQLPATVISRALDDSSRCSITNYKWSMMWRLIEENKQPNLMLDIQYRMHPQICQWPSSQYYSDRLITSPEILPMPLLDNTNIMSRPYAIYQIFGQAVSGDGSQSAYNIQEAQYVTRIIENIRQKTISKSIGVITPYAAQKQLINRNLSKKKHLLTLVDVNTVDGFQGDERDIIIISFTRTHVSEFLKEFRRLNVAITRAKYCLIILGARSLLSNDIGQLMADAERRKVLFSEKDLNNLLRPGAVPIAQQRVNVVTDPLVLAWQGEPDAQLWYAKTLLDKRQAMLWYRRAAENNNAEAQYYMGQLYLSDNDLIKKDIQLGVALLKKSAQQNFPAAQYLLGKYCVLGSVVVKNIALGITLCELAARNNVIDAIIFLARLYEEGTDLPRNAKHVEKYYRQGATLDDLFSIEKLAGLLAGGTLDNQQEALEWYRKVAEKEIITAYYPLAHLLNNVFNNQIEAFIWYSKAAEHGHKEAQYELGLRFKHGSYGCVVDIVQSIHFFKLAAISGHTEAQFVYASFLKEEGNNSEAINFFKLAADHGHGGSQYQVALLMYNQDKHRAYSYFLKAAYQNHSLAQQQCIHYQIEFNLDLTVCLRFCEQLAVDGDPQAQFLCARILDTGLVGATNKKQAYHYYSLLAQGKHLLAQYYCAILLESGMGINRDLVTARRYYESCIEQSFGARLRLACLLLREIDHDLQDTQLVYSKPGHQQDRETTELYQKPIELLEYYLKNYQEEKPLTKTIEHFLECLVLNSPVRHSAYDIGVINTHSTQANYLLGRIFQEGIGVIADIRRALHHYQLASALHPDASYRAGYIYEAGIGIAKNGSTANEYYRIAASRGHELATKRLTWSYYWLFTQKEHIPDDETVRKTKSNNCTII